MKRRHHPHHHPGKYPRTRPAGLSDTTGVPRDHARVPIRVSSQGVLFQLVRRALDGHLLSPHGGAPPAPLIRITTYTNCFLPRSRVYSGSSYTVRRPAQSRGQFATVPPRGIQVVHLGCFAAGRLPLFRRESGDELRTARADNMAVHRAVPTAECGPHSIRLTSTPRAPTLPLHRC